MAQQRSGHTQTLLNDGRVLMTGGVDGGQQLLAGGLQLIDVPTFTTSCELFQPGPDTLTATAPLVLARAFHGASVLPSGDVLVTGGAASIGGYGEAAATNTCVVYDPIAGIWASSGNLLTGVAFHRHVIDPATAGAMVFGGFVGNFTNLQGTNQTARHDGTTATALAPLASHPQLMQPDLGNGTFAASVLHDGTILVSGGFAASIFGGAETDRCFVYVP
jgi:hypothetical protein